MNPMTGEQHERAVEAVASRLIGALQQQYERGRTPEYQTGPGREQARRLAVSYIDAYHRSLREQGVCLVDLRDVLDTIRVETYGEDDPLARHARVVADFLERRFGGNEGSE